MKKYKQFLVILLLTPFFVWSIVNFRSFLNEWKNAPVYLSTNLTSLTSHDQLYKIEEVRWNAFGSEKEDFLSKFYYNKGYFLVDRFFDYLTFLSPRFYFQSGDGRVFSPKGVEPIVSLLFPFFILGIVNLVEKKNLRIPFLVFISSILSYLAGQKSFAFLLPVGILYVYVSIVAFKNKPRALTLVVGAYSLFLIGRTIWQGV